MASLDQIYERFGYSDAISDLLNLLEEKEGAPDVRREYEVIRDVIHRMQARRDERYPQK